MITLIKGISGSGKSTRLFYVVDFLRSYGYKMEPLKLYGGKAEIGIQFKELQLAALGKLYNSGVVERFQGMDAVTGHFGTSQGLSDYLLTISRDFSLIIEGAGTSATYRLRPNYLLNTLGFSRVYIQYYRFQPTEKPDYLARIVYRSGAEPSKGTMWTKNANFSSDYKNSLLEMKGLPGHERDIFLSDDSIHAPFYDFGVKFLDLFAPQLTDDFLQFCKTSNYVERNSFDYQQKHKP